MRPIDVLDAGAIRHPDRPLLIYGEESISYEQARALTCRIAQRLQSKGFGPDTRGAVLAPNDAQGFLCSLGLLRAGVTWVPLSPRDGAAYAAGLVRRFDVSVLFISAAFEDAIPAIRAEAPDLQEVVIYDRDLDGWLGDASTKDIGLFDDPDAIAAIFPTSGTTGEPRGVMHSNRGFGVLIKAMSVLAPHEGIPVFLAAAPLTHVSGRIALSLMDSGVTVVVLAQASVEGIIDALEAHEVTMTMLPPTVLYMLVDTPGIHQHAFPALQYLAYGSAPMRLDKLRQAIDIFGSKLSQGYGQTEAPMLITALDGVDHFENGEQASDERLSSVGRPTPFTELRVVDPDDQEVAHGAIGEVCVRGDYLMTGYFRDPAATADVFRDGWHHTGDLGFIDAEGFLHLVDRKKDMIISGGFNVYSAEVEAAIGELKGVAAVAVVGLPDEKWGEAVTAVVVADPVAPLSSEGVIEHVRQRLGAVKAPKTVEFWDVLPRNTTGKVLKRTIRATRSDGAPR